MDSYHDGVAVDISSTDFTPASVADAIFIGGAGTGVLIVQTASGATLTFNGLTANTILPVRVKKVVKTGTGTTNMVLLYGMS